MATRGQVFFIAGVLVVTVAVVIGAAVLFGGGSSSTFVATTAAPITSADHTQGDITSSVSVIEYGDFECPACGAYEPGVEELEQTYGSRVQFVFRNFPLTEIHPNAMAGAEAAEAAGLEGQYWPMHNLLFAKQAEWSVATGTAVAQDLDRYAASLGLNVATFNADMQSAQVAEKIQSDITSGNDAKIGHTPTFFINLNQIQNVPYAVFASAIDAALKNAK